MESVIYQSYMDLKSAILCFSPRLTAQSGCLNYFSVNDIHTQNIHGQQRATTKLTGLKLSRTHWVIAHLKEIVAVTAGETEGVQVLSPLGGWLGIS